MNYSFAMVMSTATTRQGLKIQIIEAKDKNRGNVIINIICSKIIN
jgi:hypothetical protein